MLIVTELSEAMEAWRDDNKTNFEEELADTFIRLLHMVLQLGYKNTFEKMIRRKIRLNHERPYHNGRKRQ
jgi:NTP pyrophosphatase (non-canonical NTP hydrolase)